MKINNTVLKNIINIKTAVVLVLVIAAAGGLLWYRSGITPEIQYKTSSAVTSDLRSIIQATGSLAAVESVDVGTQISGTVKEVYIDYNSIVKKGDLIAEIDSSTLKADVDEAKANLLSAEADLSNKRAVLENARKNLSRTKELAKKDLIAQSDVDADVKSLLTAEADVAAYKADVAQYRALLSKAQINLGYTKIYSPVDGVVIAKNVDKGQTVAASYQTPSIAQIARDLKQMQIEVDVDEADIGGVRDGQKAEFTVDAYPNESFEGTVTQVRLSPTTTDNVVTYTVIVRVHNEKGLLLPGMTANVSLIVQERKNVLIVPNSAFRFKPVDLNETTVSQGPPGRGKQNIAKVTAPAVYTLDGKNVPVKVEVKKGITDGQNTEIISGIKENERVITGIVVEKEEK